MADIYPTRTRAAYPPPRSGVNLFIVCCWRLGSLDWASWKSGLGVSQTLQKQTKMAYPIDPCHPKLGYPIGPWRPKQGYPIGPGGTGSWDALGGVLGASWDRLQAVLSPSWGRPRPVLGRLGCVLWFLGGFLRASWRILWRLGAVLRRIQSVWRRLGTRLREIWDRNI